MGDPDSPTFADCNTARMTVGDLGYWLLRLHEDKHREHALVSYNIAQPVLELMGYAPANLTRWRSEESRDHHLSWLYCGGERTAARHPTGRMYARGGSLPDICSAYTTRAQLNCLVAQASVWATGFFAKGSLPAPASDLLGHPSAPPAPTVPTIAAPDSRPIAERRPARRLAEPGSFGYEPPDDHPDEPVVQPRRRRAASQPPRDGGRARRRAGGAGATGGADDGTLGSANRHALRGPGGKFCRKDVAATTELAPLRTGPEATPPVGPAPLPAQDPTPTQGPPAAVPPP